MAFKLTGKNFLKNCSEAVGVGGDPVQKEKLPGREQVVTSIRLNEKTNEYIKIKASEIGISQNAFMMVLIDLGIRVYESEVSFNPQSE